MLIAMRRRQQLEIVFWPTGEDLANSQVPAAYKRRKSKGRGKHPCDHYDADTSIKAAPQANSEATPGARKPQTSTAPNEAAGDSNHNHYGTNGTQCRGCKNFTG